MIKKYKTIQWANKIECLSINADDSVNVNLVLTEGTGEEEKVIKREDSFSFPVNSEAYLALALTESEIEELKNPTQEELPV